MRAEEVLTILNSLAEGSENNVERLFFENEINYVIDHSEQSTFDFDSFVKSLRTFINNHSGLLKPEEHVLDTLIASIKLLDALKIGS